MVVDQPRLAEPNGEHRETPRRAERLRVDDLGVFDLGQGLGAEAAEQPGAQLFGPTLAGRVCRRRGAQPGAQGHRGPALVGVQVHVARAQGEPIPLPHGGHDANIHAQVEVAYEALDDSHLLRVLLAEVSPVRLDGREQLGDDSGHALEVPGPGRSLERLGHAADMDARARAARIHDLGRGMVDRVHVGLGKQSRIAVQVARIALEVLTWSELNWVDEGAGDDDVVLPSRGAGQAQVAGVQGAHRGHEADRPALAAPPARRIEHRARRRDFVQPPYLTSSRSLAGAEPLAEYSCSGPGNLPVRTSSAYAPAARVI